MPPQIREALTRCKHLPLLLYISGGVGVALPSKSYLQNDINYMWLVYLYLNVSSEVSCSSCPCIALEFYAMLLLGSCLASVDTVCFHMPFEYRDSISCGVTHGSFFVMYFSLPFVCVFLETGFSVWP